MQNSFKYTCHYCFKEYIPTKRGRQKFCTTSCRVACFNANKNKESKFSNNITSNEVGSQNKKGSSKVNVADIANAAIGHAASSILLNIFTPKSKKPITKQDLDNLKATFQGERYRPILNCPPDAQGQNAYFDLNTNEVIFSFNKLE